MSRERIRKPKVRRASPTNDESTFARDLADLRKRISKLREDIAELKDDIDKILKEN